MSYIGEIIMWGGTLNNIPAGWMHCDGTLLNQQQYYDLFSVIQFNFGANPPVGQFYLPDLRGRFVRGVDDGTNRDPDVATRTDMQNNTKYSTTIGSVQTHAFQNHTHAYYTYPQTPPTQATYPTAQGSQMTMATELTAVANPSNYKTSTETRPINAYLYYIICVQS